MTSFVKMIAVSAIVSILTAGAVSATTVTATSVTANGLTVATAANTTNRTNLGNAIGASNAFAVGNSVYGGFYSLGIGGSADFHFGTNFSGAGAVVEVTAGTRHNYLERARVFALNVSSGLWDDLGVITNGAGGRTDPGNSALALAITLPLRLGDVYSALRLTDMSTGQGRDGFDVDSISVSAVPLPAAGFLLIGAMGGLAALRRRKTAA